MHATRKRVVSLEKDIAEGCQAAIAADDAVESRVALDFQIAASDTVPAKCWSPVVVTEPPAMVVSLVVRLDNARWVQWRPQRSWSRQDQAVGRIALVVVVVEAIDAVQLNVSAGQRDIAGKCKWYRDVQIAYGSKIAVDNHNRRVLFFRQRCSRCHDLLSIHNAFEFNASSLQRQSCV